MKKIKLITIMLLTAIAAIAQQPKKGSSEIIKAETPITGTKIIKDLTTANKIISELKTGTDVEDFFFPTAPNMGIFEDMEKGQLVNQIYLMKEDIKKIRLVKGKVAKRKLKFWRYYDTDGDGFDDKRELMNEYLWLSEYNIHLSDGTILEALIPANHESSPNAGSFRWLNGIIEFCPDEN